MDVRSQMRRSARFNRDRTAIITETTTVTFGESWSRGCRLANGLAALGVRPGDRVGGLEDNDLAAADFYVGCAAGGFVRNPLYPRNSPEAHAHMLDHSQCKVLVVDPPYVDAVRGMEHELADLHHIIVRDESYEDWLASFPDTDPNPAIDENDWFIIRHSGGTTGRAKGVGYTHRTWINASRDWFYPFPPVETLDVIGHAGPISHGSGYFFLPGWMAGAANLLVNGFDPVKVLDLMERHGVTHIFLVPTMVNAMVRHPSAAGRDWSRLKCLNIAGSPITDDTALLAREVFGERLWQLYGETEALPAVAMSPSEWFGKWPGSTPLRAAGRLMPWSELEICDPDTNKVLEVGEEGEIVLRTDGQMLGFWDEPELTASRVLDRGDGRPWVLTGDIGRLDENGYLYVLDRKDDMIISGGFNIWPAELESVLTDHPAVVEAAVFGVPHQRWGETPFAHCQVDGTTAVTEDELVQLCATTLGSCKKPSGVVLSTDPLPHSPVGKLMRKLLREPYWSGHERRVAGS
ncbi:MAG: AMP-binding protein [Acidimicrobiia bacterium]|nr:AMP-binding protein [Acidimicrobiia bacterium]